MKKYFRRIALAVIVAIFALFAVSTSSEVFAAEPKDGGSNSGSSSYVFSGRSISEDACNDNFIGLVAWDCGVNIDGQKSLASDIWIIASNVATDIAVIAAYLVIGYVIYGGYLYTFSSGDAGKVATGKKTLIQAFVGLAITMLANVIIATIRIALVGNSGNIGNCISGVDACVSAGDLIENLLYWVIRVAGVVSAIFLVYGGIQYVTSAGDPTKLKRAKDTILYSLIGLAIVALATAITAFVSSTIRNARGNESSNTSPNSSIVMSKEAT